jgi:hypothetical protein
VFDLMGRLLAQQTLDVPAGTSVQALDLNGYPTGTYLVRVSNAQGAATRRIVVE